MVSTSTPSPQQPDLHAVKQRQQKMWSTGNYREIGARLVILSERLCEAVDLRAGDRVLDVASGTGNAALAAARRFCDVTSTDYVPELLERGRERAEAEGLPITHEVADAENLPYEDGSFDVVLSVIGAMFAPDQQRAAQELTRVCRPGGKIGMANWTPDSFAGDLFKLIAKYNPPPPGVKPPSVWGTEEGLRELFGDGVVFQHLETRTYRFRFRSPDHVIDFFRENFGPMRTACEALDSSSEAELCKNLRDRSAELNQSGDDTVVIDAGYLEVVAVRA